MASFNGMPVGSRPSVSTVKAITTTNLLPATGDLGATFSIEDQKGETHQDVISMATIDENYIQTMGFELIEGRNFNEDLATDVNTVIVNETLVNKYEWTVGTLST